jgi:PTS system cellobiose-specific IIA component
MDEQNELIMAAMNIILNAGDARNFASDALTAAKQFDFETAAKNMEKAEKSIVLAHKTQTEIIQNEASGENYDLPLLFIHAQDTLMTIQSELTFSKELIDVLKIIDQKEGKKND